MSSRPYLSERANGEGASVAGVFAMMVFLAVIGMWLYSARGMLTVFARTLGLNSKAPMADTINALNGGGDYPAVNVGQVARLAQEKGRPVESGTPTPELQGLKPTYTPYPTYTLYPTYTPEKEITVISRDLEKNYDNLAVPEILGVADPGLEWETMTIRISYYWPPLGGINCDTNPDGSPECEQMANGERWDNQVGQVVACPVEIPLGTLIKINDRVLTCKDRGGEIVQNSDGSYWIDVLYPSMPWGYKYGDYVQAFIWKN